MTAAFIPAAIGVAQLVVGRVVNSLPEGLLLTLAAWLLLRMLGRQNARTRFAVWIVALGGVAALPFLGSRAAAAQGAGAGPHAELVIPALAAVLFVALWIPIAVLALARVWLGLRQVRAIRRECVAADLASLDQALRDTLLKTAASRRVRLLVSESARVPAAIGFYHPAVVLPAWCLREMSAAELQPILIHELTHLERRDDWTNLLQKVVRAVFFFHPAIWWIDRRLAVEREMACDDAVLAAMGNARAYAGSLVSLLERSCARRGWTMAQAAVSRAREASQRIARILSGGAASTRIGRGALGMAAALCAASFVAFVLAPQLVGFAPETELAAAQAPGNTRDVLRLHGDLYHASVVPAAFHPGVALNPGLPMAPAHRAQVRAVAVAAAHRGLGAGRPAVILAKLDERKSAAPIQTKNVPAPQPMLMLFETADAGAAPVPTEPAAAAPERSSTATAAPPALPAAILAGSPGVLQIRTLQVLEEDDTGWHLHVYRMFVLVPVGVQGSQHSST